MKLIICSVRDRAANVFGRPFFSPSRGVALRSFGDEVNTKSENNLLNKHPEDFDLFCLGEWDDATGQFSLLEHPEQIAVGKDQVR